MLRRSMTGRLLLAAVAMLAACSLISAAPASQADLQIASIQVERDVVNVDVVNSGSKAGSALLVVTVLIEGKPVQEIRSISVKGQGQTREAVVFEGPVNGVLSTGLVDAAEPQ